MTKSLTSYDILNVNENASQDDIHTAYRKLAMSWHPDRHHGNENQKHRANRNFQLLQSAYNDLKTPDARSIYNQRLAREKRAILVNQNKVINDNSPMMSFLHTLDKILNPSSKRK